MIHSDSAEPSSTLPGASTDKTAQGNLLGCLTAAFYTLFTLLPNSNSLMVAWSWVFIWQIGLLCPVLWLLSLLWQKRLRWLGHGFDWLVGLLVVGLIMSAGLAPFPMQAHWYSWAAFCFLAALYALSTWLSLPERRSRLLVAQGYLSLAFIVVSLTLWSNLTLLPELAHLQAWRAYGVTLPFDFAIVELRNWAPIGHQNYVAGYLVLVLPLLLGLGVVQTGWRRSLWLLGFGLGLLDLYTTSSRGGWLGLFAMAIVTFGVLLWRSRLPRLWLGAIGLGGVALLALALTNNRLRLLLTGALSGQASGELAYRLITITAGWSMGWSRPFTGVGLGGVPLLFQQYRPAWAGRQAEWAYQLHSTPAHLWAELGLWAVAVSVGTIALLSSLAIAWLRSSTLSTQTMVQTPPILIGCLFSSLLGYGVVSLTDYQLDNICISGTLVVFLAVLTAAWRDRRDSRPQEGDRVIDLSTASPHPLTPLLLHPVPFLPLMGVGILMAAGIWLAPAHRAWLLSSQGFAALSRGDVATFVDRLSQSHHLASWEPYYAYELGWNLGNLGLQARDPAQQQQLVKQGVDWLKLGNRSAPNQEFGSTNLAWLLLREPKAASHAFARSTQLVPAKRGIFYGLGLSLLAQGETELAIAAMTLEALRDPILLTSPIWKLPELQPLYAPVTRRVESEVTALLETTPNAMLAAQLHQIRGGLRWWQGNIAGARTDLTTFGTALSRVVLDLVEKPIEPSRLSAWSNSGSVASRSGALAIAAWLDPAKRQNLLQQAWIVANHADPPPNIISELTATMARSSTFDQWLKQNAPSQPYRRERAGFGVLSRHIDGAIPVDFLTVVDNLPIAQFCKDLIVSFDYAPDLDTALQSRREALVQKVLKL